MRKFGRGSGILLNLVPAVMLGGAVAFLAGLAPLELIERLVARSYLALLIPQARPPIGMTGRALVAGGLGGGAAVVAFVAALCLGRLGRRRTPAPAAAMPVRAPIAPVLRRSDRHADAPSKRPLFARDELGASFDALAEAPQAAPAPIAESGPEAPRNAERIDRPTPPTGGISLADLLARLEQGVGAPAAAGCPRLTSLSRRIPSALR